jgi:hypothetical protein
MRFVRNMEYRTASGPTTLRNSTHPFCVKLVRFARRRLAVRRMKDYVRNLATNGISNCSTQTPGQTGLTPCDVSVKRDPAVRHVNSGRWQSSHHARNVHCFWVVVRKDVVSPEKVRRLDGRTQEVMRSDR